MKQGVFAAICLSALLISQAFGQQSWELDRLDEKLVRHMEKTMPEWKHERVEPIAGSEDVLIEFWSFSNRKVKVSILLHSSEEKARAVIQDHARYSFNLEAVQGLGDEAYSSGYASSLVAFRKGKLTIYVSTYADTDSDPDAQSLTQAQRLEREQAEMKRLSKELAKQVAAGIDAQ
jgi:hypothetical protein